MKKKTKKTEKKRPGPGRPSIFNEVLASKMIELFEKGRTEEQVAKIMGVSISSLRLWKTQKTQFKWSVNEAKMKADEMVEASLYHKAIGYSHPEEKVFCNYGVITTHETIKHYPPETNAAIYWLNNRKPDKWKARVNVVVDESVPIEVGLPDGGTEKI